ncbi:MAG: helix-turn-helix domain-containing protein [Patescibacteria group bacterium]|nr:helix-turn-helix domain-containing protein [Patescibacteria group bacterium]
MLTVGEILKNERVKKNIGLEEVEKKTRIRKKYLEAIERNEWDFFSSKIYIIGILKTYAKFLNLDESKVLAFFRRDYEKKEDLGFRKKLTDEDINPQGKVLWRRLIFIIFLFFFLYFGFQLYLYFSPPKGEILSPKQSVFKRENKIKIVGRTDLETMIFIQGQRIYQNKEGIFEYDLPLKTGENRLVVELIGANGRRSKIERVFIKEAPK